MNHNDSHHSRPLACIRDARRGATRDRRLAKDPVCGMDVVPETAAGSIEHDGRTIYFCSRHCVEKFRADPARYHRPIAAAGHDGLDRPDPDLARPARTRRARATPARCIPEIVRDRPGPCPICGMALEPMTVTADDEADPELADMTRRFWISLALTVPLLLLSMGEMIPGLGLHSLLGRPGPGLDPARPGARRWSSGAAGRSSSGPGPRSKSRQLNMFTLIAMGTGTAYLFSVVAAIAPGLFPDSFRDHTARSRSTSSPRR